MKPPDFDYARPTTLDEALALARDNPGARYLAGGQSLLPMLNMRLAHPDLLIDLNRVGGLAMLQEADGGLAVGALVRHRDMERAPLLAQRWPLLATMARAIGHPAIRSRGTVGGSLAHGDPAAEWPLAMVALEARLQVASADGSRREIAAEDFWLGPLITALGAGELLLGAWLPPQTGRWRFAEVSRRHGDFALAATVVGRDDRGWHVAVGGVEGAPRRLRAIETALAAGVPPRPELAERVAGALAPLPDDLHASGPYRAQVAGNLVARLVEEVAAGA